MLRALAEQIINAANLICCKYLLCLSAAWTKRSKHNASCVGTILAEKVSHPQVSSFRNLIAEFHYDKSWLNIICITLNFVTDQSRKTRLTFSNFILYLYLYLNYSNNKRNSLKSSFRKLNLGLSSILKNEPAALASLLQHNFYKQTFQSTVRSIPLMTVKNLNSRFTQPADSSQRTLSPTVSRQLIRLHQAEESYGIRKWDLRDVYESSMKTYDTELNGKNMITTNSWLEHEDHDLRGTQLFIEPKAKPPMNLQPVKNLNLERTGNERSGVWTLIRYFWR